MPTWHHSGNLDRACVFGCHAGIPCYQGKYQGAKKAHPRATRISTLYDGAQTNPGRKSKAKIRAEQGENSSVHGISRTAG
jgi:hypothetical protein